MVLLCLGTMLFIFLTLDLKLATFPILEEFFQYYPFFQLFSHGLFFVFFWTPVIQMFSIVPEVSVLSSFNFNCFSLMLSFIFTIIFRTPYLSSTSIVWFKCFEFTGTLFLLIDFKAVSILVSILLSVTILFFKILVNLYYHYNSFFMVFFLFGLVGVYHVAFTC